MGDRAILGWYSRSHRVLSKTSSLSRCGACGSMCPPEWALSYPNRIMEMVYIFLIENCAHADAKAFPGMDALIVSTRMPPSPTNKVGCRPLESSSISHSID